ncbi:uncharacterized protein LOC143345620 [Colletes latitarsis]|uniref:uncharacterized protein LOC143345620 n=1 Tax=Colletes latitarsis TaxID=2605962 RepID=UPI004036034A
MIATETFLVMLMTHCCAMFKIIGYRIRCAINGKKKYLVYAKLIEAVLLHRRAIELLSQARLQTNKLTVAVMEIVIVLAHFLYLFLANYIGQIIIDSSTEVFTSAYHSRWYLTAVPEQKLFLFIQLHNLKNYSFHVGGLFTPSYEGFSTLVRMSFSYFTVIYSTQL